MQPYLVEKSAILRQEAALLAAGLLLDEASGKLQDDDHQVAGTTVVHGHAMLDALMLSLLTKMEACTGLSLLPTYSYARIYRRGDELKKHSDRPACEVSATMTLGYLAPMIWPIFAGESGPIALDVGDMLVYRGCEVEHWREPFFGDLWVQVFLHYVDRNGPHAEHAFDKRDVGALYSTIYSAFLRG